MTNVSFKFNNIKVIGLMELSMEESWCAGVLQCLEEPAKETGKERPVKRKKDQLSRVPLNPREKRYLRRGQLIEDNFKELSIA